MTDELMRRENIYEVKSREGVVLFVGTLAECTAWYESTTGQLVENAGRDPAEPKRVLQ